MVEKILLANPRGFCAGVERAIEIVEKALELYGKPVYVRHQIVHNDFVVKDLIGKGAVFVEKLSEIPKGSVVVLSAHGSDPKVREKAKDMGFTVIDAVCPLVTKVHLEAIKYDKKDYSQILIGHAGHQEVIGTMGEAEMQLVENVGDVEKLKVEDGEKVVYHTQTTLSVDEARDIIEALEKRFPKIIGPPRKDICYATTNRQKAVKEMALHADLILVIGDRQSSNSNRLVEAGKICGVESYLISDKGELDEAWLEGKKIVGISSGASVPDVLVRGVIDMIMHSYPLCKEEPVVVAKEKVVFSLPQEVVKKEVSVRVDS